ncbi:MAG TPA: host-nuclease inhibitor Gam family protein [Armatimonadota bacterium]|nr:host-nuclease inhibitor Gam family protein [Armatimonadota bacterium]
MPKKAKPKPPTFRSWDEADGAGQEVLKTSTQLEMQKTAMNAEIDAIKARYKDPIQALEQEKDLLLKGIEDFVEGRRTELDGKSRQLTHVVVGYSLNPPRVKATLKSFAESLKRMLGLGRKASAYIATVTKQDIDKSAVLAAHKAEKLTDVQLAEFGLAVAQDEVFYCKPIEAKVAEVDPAA